MLVMLVKLNMLKRGENENKTTLVFWDSELRDI